MARAHDTRRRVDRALARALALVVFAGAVGLTACAPATRAAVERDAWRHVRATAAESGELPRWPASTELVVDVTNLAERDAALVFRAFDAWLEGSKTSLAVRRAGPGDRANVVIRDVGEIDAGYESMGLTHLEWDRGGLVRAEVLLARSSRCGTFLTSLERERAVHHEIGHVLGLGHSPRLSSIMHRSTPGTDVDASDRAALVLLYGLRTVRVASTAPAPEAR